MPAGLAGVLVLLLSAPSFAQSRPAVFSTQFTPAFVAAAAGVIVLVSERGRFDIRTERGRLVRSGQVAVDVTTSVVSTGRDFIVVGWRSSPGEESTAVAVRLTTDGSAARTWTQDAALWTVHAKQGAVTALLHDGRELALREDGTKADLRHLSAGAILVDNPASEPLVCTVDSRSEASSQGSCAISEGPGAKSITGSWWRPPIVCGGFLVANTWKSPNVLTMRVWSLQSGEETAVKSAADSPLFCVGHNVVTRDSVHRLPKLDRVTGRVCGSTGNPIGVFGGDKVICLLPHRRVRIVSV